MLSVNQIKMEFGGFTLFSDVTFNLSPGDRVGLIGKNGAGKSTLLKIISSKINPDSGKISHPKTFKIGYLPQEVDVNSDESVFSETKTALTEVNEIDKKISSIEVSLSNRTDYESDEYQSLINDLTYLSERFDALGGNALESKIGKVLTGLGFSNEELSKKVNELSGGWQMRIELAKILLSNPDCILLDEPTNHLDIESVLWLEDFLKNYEGSIVIISHDRKFLDNVTNRTIELTMGKTYDLKMPYSKFIDQRDEIRKVQIAAKKSQDKKIAEIENFVTKYKAKARQASRAQSKLKQLDKINRIEVDEEDYSQIHFNFPPPPRSPRLVCEAIDLTKSYGEKRVLSTIDFAIERGEKIAFVGRNGEGKSTLSKIIAGIEPYNGEFHLGKNIEIGYFAQHQAKLLEGNNTVFEIIDQKAKGEIRTQIRNLLGAFLFSGDDVYKKVSVLSGGEKSRLALASLLLEPSNLLIMDEPTNHLDMASKDILKNALQNFEGTVILVSHDRDFLEGLTNKTIEFKDQKIKEVLGDINDYLSFRNARSLAEIEKKDKKTNTRTVSQDIIDKKEFQKIQRRLSREIETLEKEISEKEELIADKQNLFASPEYINDPNLMHELQKEINEIESQLNVSIEKWEQHSEELEELEKQYEGEQ